MIGRISRALWSNPKRKALSIVSGLALAAATAAFAAWLISATGPGSGQVGNLQAPTVAAATSAPKEQCFPGQKCALSFKITSPDSGDLTLTGVSPSASSSVSDSSSTCQYATPFTVGSVTGLNITVPGNQTTTVEVPDAVTMAANAPNDCQGTSFTVSGVSLQFQAGS